MATTVGLIGVGAMGQALLHRLNLAGVETRAYDISPECMKTAEDMGAGLCTSPADAARGVDFVHLFVRTAEQEIDATTGKDGVLSGMDKGAILILHSTVFPEITQQVADAAAENGIKVMDAPVTAVPARVHAGEGVFLCGGDDDVLAKARPHLESVGKAVYHFGKLGTGNVAKLAKNLMSAIERVASSEVVAMAEKGGIPAERFLELMTNEHTGPGSRDIGRAFEVKDGHATPKPASNLLNKDIGLAETFCKKVGVDAPVTSAAAATAKGWVKGWGQEWHS